MPNDPLDADIAAQKSAGNVHYMRTLEVIRDRLQAIERRQHAFKGVAWLIECGFDQGLPDYYCGPGDWCSNPNHAHKFLTKEEAEAVSERMTTIGARRVADHSWG